MGNFYFLICSIPLLLTLIAYKTAVLEDGLLFFMISIIFEAPAFTALCSTMGKIVRENDANITKDYFKAYKINFLQSLFLGALQSLFLFILIEDIKIFKITGYSKILLTVFMALILIVMLMDLYIFPILSRFYLKTIDILKLSLYCCIKKFKITLLNISVIIIAAVLLQYLPAVSMFFVISIVSYLIMFFEKDILKSFEEKIKTDSNSKA